MKENEVITKAKIRKYLGMYKNLEKIIKKRELRWILEKGPSFEEWEQKKNTVEKQAINLIEDKKLNELRFYKINIKKYILKLNRLKDKKYYNYFLYRYIKNYPEEKIKELLKIEYNKLMNEKIINYLYINLKKEFNNYEKNNKLKDLIINKNKYLKIVYMDNDDIIDYETIEIKIIKIRKYNKLINDIAYKMYKLNANGFYFIFNKNISLNKIIFSIKLKKDLLGFLGYILIKHNNYSYILNNNGKIKININKKIDNFSGINPKKLLWKILS